MLPVPERGAVLFIVCQHCSPDQQQTQHQLCRNSALVQPQKAELEGKSEQFEVEGRGGNRGEKAAHAEKASPSLLHPPQDPVKGFGAKVSIIFFVKKENSLQKFPG